ncbi:MAG: glycoside hydrolase family 140 protein [Oscillospiraceae bacterium]|jgi:hypothetical protein|nr:glycoside hydrolase family 140 protein [Oscillospiraceae bacterium]
MSFQKLSVSADGRRLIQSDGSPFFYLGDTGWELFHRLNREDAVLYLQTRADAGFTAIQAVALAEFDGLESPNAYGRRPLKRNSHGEWDPTLPDLDDGYDYWDHVDFILLRAERLGLYIALLPTWGDKLNNRVWGKGPRIFDGGNAYAYGLWMGRRYADRPNIIWVLGGDRPLETRLHFEAVCGMAKGLREGDGGAHLITFHPTGGQHSSVPLHDEDWLDFNMIQSGHDRKRFNYEMIAKDYALSPPKPILDAEPGYEDHPDAFRPANGFLDAADARQFAYMALLSGGCGHTYGNHSVWGFVESLPVDGFQPGHFCATWRKALYSPGAGQMRHAKDLLLSRDFLSGTPAPGLVEHQLEGTLHIPVLKGRDYLMAYAAMGQPITLKADCMDGAAFAASWHDPRTGGNQPCDTGKSNSGPLTFYPPSGGRGQDWVLVLDVVKGEL